MSIANAIDDIKRLIFGQEFQLAVEELDPLLRDLKTYPTKKRKPFVARLVCEFEVIEQSAYHKVDEALSHVGNAFLNNGYLDEAEKFYLYSIEKRAGNVFSTTGIGRCCFLRGDYENALKWFRKSLKINPRDKFVQIKVADTYTAMEKYDEALKILRQLVTDVDAADHFVAKRIADVYLRQNRFGDALAIYEKIKEKDDERHDLTLFGLCLCYQFFGQKEAFIRTFNQFIAYDVTNARILIEMTNACYSMGMYSKAHLCAYRAVKHNPDHIFSWYWLANTCRKMKRYMMAIRICNMLLVKSGIDPEDRVRILTCKGYCFMELYRDQPTENAHFKFSEASLLGASDKMGWAAAGLVFLYGTKYRHHPEHRIEMIYQMEKYLYWAEQLSPNTKDVDHAGVMYRRHRADFEQEFPNLFDYATPNEQSSYEQPETQTDAVPDLSSEQLLSYLKQCIRDKEVDEPMFGRRLLHLTYTANGQLDRNLVSLAYAAECNGLVALGERLYLQSLIVNPTNTMALARLSGIMRKMKHFELAVILARKAHSVAVDNFHSWLSFVSALFDAERYDEGITECEQLLVFDRQYDVNIRARLAEVYEVVGEWRKAADLYDDLYEKTGQERFFAAIQRCFPHI
ncbi:TPA: hypothetical protein DF272_03040 [Candidatus Falkowbacteria bacterium]|nr:hypothetical protein [Candidatus Falkowbacteria bacterium]